MKKIKRSVIGNCGHHCYSSFLPNKNLRIYRFLQKCSGRVDLQILALVKRVKLTFSLKKWKMRALSNLLIQEIQMLEDFAFRTALSSMKSPSRSMSFLRNLRFMYFLLACLSLVITKQKAFVFYQSLLKKARTEFLDLVVQRYEKTWLMMFDSVFFFLQTTPWELVGRSLNSSSQCFECEFLPFFQNFEGDLTVEDSLTSSVQCQAVSTWH